MRGLLLLAAGILGVALYRNSIRIPERNPKNMLIKRGDSPISPNDISNFRLISPAFEPGQVIPARYSGEADDKSPPLRIEGVPVGTQSFAIIMEDIDHPLPPVFDHWIVWNIPAETREIPEGRLPRGSVQGRNSLKNNWYNGPCPPNGTHHYHFNLFALDTMIDLPVGSPKPLLKAAMKGHILAQCDLIGLYSANRTTRGNLMSNALEAASKA